MFLLGDHLGSTSKVISAAGQEVGELRYKAFGEARFGSGTTTTDYRYTGQREEAGIGLYYYNARWYDPALGRFISPDILNMGSNGSAWERYAYVRNNSLRYVDPTGYMIDPGRYEGHDDNMSTQADLQRYYGLISRKPGEFERWTREDTKRVATATAFSLTLLAAPEVLAGSAGIARGVYSYVLWNAATLCSLSTACWRMVGAAGASLAALPIRGGAEPLRRGQQGVGWALEILKRNGERIEHQEFAVGRTRVDVITTNLLVEVKNLTTVFNTQALREQAYRNSAVADYLGKDLLYVFTGSAPPESVVSFLQDVIGATVVHWPIP